MANRPLPNVDPEALSKLASQYPGSGEGRAEPKLSGSGDGRGMSRGAEVAAEASAPTAAPKPKREARGAGRSTTVLALVCAVIAVLGALAALAAPSIRTEARVLLQRHVPQLGKANIDFITGQDTRRLEITYEGLDQRIARLTQALERVVGAPGIDPAAARELLLRSEENQRLVAAEQAVAGQAAALAGTADRLGAVEARLTAFGEVGQSLDALAARADAAEQSLARLQEMAATLESRVTALAQQDGRTAEEIAGIAARVEALSADVAQAQQSMAPVAGLLAEVQNQRQSLELPLIGMSQLRMALDRNTPYRVELALAKKLASEDGDAQAALTALETNADSGVATLPGLRRDFAFVAGQMGGTLNRVQNWTQRLASWVEVLVGTRSMPEADPIGELSSAVASIDAALEAGQLDLAIQEAAALAARQSDVLLEGWVVEARRRLATERAFDQLAARIYARIGNAS